MEAKSDCCYICLEETKETSCENGCIVHDSCIRNALENGLPHHCTVCKAPLSVKKKCFETKIVKEISVTITMVLQILVAISVVVLMYLMWHG